LKQPKKIPGLRWRDGVWHADFMHEGRRVRESLKTGDQKLAQVRLGELQAALYRGTYVPSKVGGLGGTYTVSKAFDRALEGKWMVDKASNTEESARHNFRRLLEAGWLKADTPVTALDAHALEKLQVDLLKNSDPALSKSSVNKRMWVVRQLLVQARKDGAIKVLPEFPKVLPTDDAARERFLSAEEEVSVLAYLGAEDRYADLRDCYVILLDTGMRLGEATSLRAEWIDLRAGTVRLPAGRTKNGKPRTVGLTSRVRAVIERRLQLDGKNVFPIPEGCSSPKYWLYRLGHEWAAVRGELKLGDVVLHTARHTLATRLTSRGMDVRTVMEVLGHSTPKMALRYSHAVGERVLAATSAIENFAERVTSKGAKA